MIARNRTNFILYIESIIVDLFSQMKKNRACTLLFALVTIGFAVCERLTEYIIDVYLFYTIYSLWCRNKLVYDAVVILVFLYCLEALGDFFKNRIHV